ncbi:MAG: glycosyltransferase family 4 protein [Candidatus Kapabacteria bacterium]|nr:glycosyltransferase family 4 protein [Candidatus Kapabacteria bacterium]MDW8012424.1 glycosyltransferase family 4 protein [Bacteroidota bacterium]
MASYPSSHHWLCCGRFPPPRDGQSIATQELVELLAPDITFTCLNSTARPPEGRIIPPGQLRMKRVREMLRYLSTLRSFTTRHPSPILYAILSGNWLGHLRDCAAFAWAIPPRCPVVVWTHNSLQTLTNSPVGRQTLRWLARRIRFFVVAGPNLGRLLQGIVPQDRIAIIPNLIARALLCSREEVEQKLAQLPSSPLRLLFVGHMMPEKGGWRLLEAIALLQAAGIPCQATYVGGWSSPADAASFAERVRTLGLQERVHHHGLVSNSAMLRELYLTHHLMVLPTDHPLEAQPISIIEALNAGCAVISTPRGSIPDVVCSGVHGFLTGSSPEAVAAAIARYWHQPGLWQAHARAARSQFESNFSPEIIRQRWLQLLLEVEAKYRRL